MKVKVLTSFDIETRSYRPGQVVEMESVLATRLAERALVVLMAQDPMAQDDPPATPRKPDARRKP
jgi:hypothetical protein